MSSDQLTPDEFLRLDRKAIEAIFEEELPPSVGKPYFVPGLYSNLNNPTLDQMKRWKIESVGRAAERKTILNWVIPALLIIPATISFLITGFTVTTSTIFTVGAMLVIGYLWFFGRVWRWEAQRFESNVDTAENAVTRTLMKRAKQWAEERYDINTTALEWTEFSEFYIDGRAYRWKEAEDSKFIIVISSTGEEAPLLRKAAE